MRYGQENLEPPEGGQLTVASVLRYLLSEPGARPADVARLMECSGAGIRYCLLKHRVPFEARPRIDTVLEAAGYASADAFFRVHGMKTFKEMREALGGLTEQTIARHYREWIAGQKRARSGR